MKHLKFLLTIFLVAIVFNQTTVLAQEATKQRTTGTYLPVQAASMKEEKIVKVEEANTIELKDGTVKVELPEQFYDRDVRMVIRRVSWEGNSAVPALKIDGESFVGNDIFEVTALEDASGEPVFDFDQPITIHFRYFDTDVEKIDESKLKVRYFNRIDQVWEEVNERYLDMDSNTMSIEVDHLTLFAITGQTNTTVAQVQSGGLGWLVTILLVLTGITILGVGSWLAYTYYVQSKHIYSGEDVILGGSKKDNQPTTKVLQTKPTTLDSQSKKYSEQSSVPPIGANNDEEGKVEKTKNDSGNESPGPDDEIWVKF